MYAMIEQKASSFRIYIDAFTSVHIYNKDDKVLVACWNPDPTDDDEYDVTISYRDTFNKGDILYLMDEKGHTINRIVL